LEDKKLEKRQVVCNFKSLITKQLQTKYLSLTDAKAVEIFYSADEFDKAESGHLLKTDNGKKHRNRKFTILFRRFAARNDGCGNSQFLIGARAARP
jgi:hypothetical protein